MKPVFVSLLVAAAASSAIAAPAKAPARADLPGYTGFDDCRIAPLEPAPRNDAVEWSGACEGSFAVGKGELDWKDEKKNRYRLKATLVRGEVQGEGELKTAEYTYIGTFRRGVPHGAGFFTYKRGNMYEGGVVDGKHEGKGISIHPDRTEYTGEWKNGKWHGWGEIKYGLGGSYSGQWQEGKRHGHGRIVYTGSGRSYEGKFENDLVAGTAPLVEEPVKARLQSRSRTPTLTGYLPFDAGWEDLTEPQKNVARGMYPALEAGDDPPYPAKGTRELFEAVEKLNNKAGAAEGFLRVHALIGADGKAKQVNVYEKPTLNDKEDAERLVKYIASLLMMGSYKPAMCQGKPCEMVYPLLFDFSQDIDRTPPMFR